MEDDYSDISSRIDLQFENIDKFSTGGIITRIGGGKISLTEPCSILAGTKKAHKEVMKIAKEKGYSSDF